MSLLGRLPSARDQRLRSAQHHHTANQHAASPPVDSAKDNARSNAKDDESQQTSSLEHHANLKWSDFSKAYMKQYTAHKAIYYPTEDYVDSDRYSEWLESLRFVEYDSAKRVADSGFFHSVRTEDVAKVVRDALDSRALQLRDGWQDLLKLFLPHDHDGPPTGSTLSIISVNWSEAFIRWSLYLAASRLQHLPEWEKAALLTYINDMEIHSNQIHGLSSPQGSSGRLEGNIRTAKDKLAQLPRSRRLSKSRAPAEEPYVVYVGDSSTDYECLRHADAGIWVCDCLKSEYKARFVDTFKPLDLRNFTPPAVVDTEGIGAGIWCTWAPGLTHVADYLESLSRGEASHSVKRVDKVDSA